MTLDERLDVVSHREIDLFELDDALSRLGEMDERMARIVGLRFFAGLTVEEAASVMGISPATVKREWRLARAWLHEQLHGDEA